MKYDIKVKREERGITVMDVVWASDLERDKVGDAVGAILWQMERDPVAWSADIIITPVQEVQLPACEIDHSGSQAQYSRRDG
jgi:hypothetical protein